MVDTPRSSSDPASARVTDWRSIPAGVVPRHLQHWVVLGLAAVMVAILALAGPPAPRRSAPPPSSAVPVDPNQQRIEEFQRRIQEQAQRLAAEQAQLLATKDTLSAVPASPVAAPTHIPVESPGGGGTGDGPSLASDLRTRVADSVAFTRPIASGADPASAPPVGTVPPLPPVPGPVPSQTAPVATAAAPIGRVAPTRAAASLAAAATEGPRYRLFEGTVIDTVLTNRLDSTFTGPVNCLVSIPVYAADRVVIPSGARVLGEARAVNTLGQTRLAVVFHRILLPSGERIELDAFPALNQVGDLGLHDQVDRHYGEIFGVSIALGLIAGFTQGQTPTGLDATAVDGYRQGVAANVAQSSTRVLDRFLNRLPTVTIREGHRIKVYLSRDLELPAYRPALAVEGGHP